MSYIEFFNGTHSYYSVTGDKCKEAAIGKLI